MHAVSAQLKLNNGVGKLFLNSRGLFTLRLFWPSIQILIQSKHRVISDWMLGKFAISSYESDPYSSSNNVGKKGKNLNVDKLPRVLLSES